MIFNYLAQNWIEITAVIFAICYLVLAVKQNILCWICGIISSALYFFIMRSAGLYMEAYLQIFYICMGIYGWSQWRIDASSSAPLVVYTWSKSKHFSAISLILSLSFISALLLELFSDAVLPFLDALVTWGAVVATYMVAKKLLENWIYWLVIDSISIFLFISRDLWPTAFLFGVYLVIITFGYHSWSKALKRKIVHSKLDKIKLVPEGCILRNELSSSPISKIYLCDFHEMKAVIRFDHAIASKLAIERQNEINILKGINHLSLGPEILYSDSQAGIMIWKYISGTEPNFVEDEDRPYTLRDLGSCLYSLHNFQMPGHSIDVFSNSLDLYKKLIENPSDKLMLKKALALYDKLNKDGVRKVLSHNDLHRSNLLWDNKYYFLDWEYSGLNHPCFDIASLVKSFQLNQSQITELSNGYKGNKQLFHVDTLNQWIEFIYYLEEIWRLSVKNLEDLKA